MMCCFCAAEHSAIIRFMTRSISVRQAQAFDKYAQTKLGVPSVMLMECGEID